MGDGRAGEIVERGDHSLDEGFKAIFREIYENRYPVITDYEVLPRAKRVDIGVGWGYNYNELFFGEEIMIYIEVQNDSVVRCSIVERVVERMLTEAAFRELFGAVTVDGESFCPEGDSYELMSAPLSFSHPAISDIYGAMVSSAPIKVEAERYSSDAGEFCLFTITLPLSELAESTAGSEYDWERSVEEANSRALLIRELALAWVESRNSLLATISADNKITLYKGRKVFPTKFGWWNWYSRELKVRNELTKLECSRLEEYRESETGLILRSSDRLYNPPPLKSRGSYNALHMEYFARVDIEYYNKLNPNRKRLTKEMIAQIAKRCKPLKRGEYYRAGKMMSKCPFCGKGLLYKSGSAMGPPTGSWVSYDVTLFCPGCGEYHRSSYSYDT